MGGAERFSTTSLNLDVFAHESEPSSRRTSISSVSVHLLVGCYDGILTTQVAEITAPCCIFTGSWSK